MLRKFSWIVFAVAMTLGGCASTEGISDSVVSTNLEFEQTQNKTLLLNVVRASLRRPPVYHALQSVTGTVRPSGEVSLGIPFGPGADANSLGISIKGNDGPSLTTAPLATQEFYQGIMTPIKMSTIDFYVQQGYSRSLLFNLLINRVEVRRGSKSVVFGNSAGRDKDLMGFQLLIDRLISLGLTTEKVDGDSSSFGPPRMDREVRKVADVASAAKAELEINEVAWCDMTADDWRLLISARGAKVARKLKDRTKKEADPVILGQQEIESACKNAATAVEKAKVIEGRFDVKSRLYNVEKPADDVARFCFDPRLVEGQGGANAAPNTCVHSTSGADTVELTMEDLDKIAMDDALWKGLNGANGNIELAFVPRSTDGVVYYLGEVARRRLYPDRERARTIGYHHGAAAYKKESFCELPAKADEQRDDDCYAIFWVGNEPPSAKDVTTVDYEGVRFAVRGAQPGVAGLTPSQRSSQVLGIVLQLLALNQSAKDLPSTSIVNVVAQ